MTEKIFQKTTNLKSPHNWEENVISLPYAPPLDWEILLLFFRSHQILGIEQITLTSYERLFYLNNISGFLRVTHHDTAPELILSIFTKDQTVLPLIEQRIRRMFDLDLNTSTLDDRFLTHPLLNPIWRAYPGLRLASGWDTFETAINTILGQLVSVQRAKALMQQLVEHQGEQIINPITNEKVYLFPTPRQLANANLENLGTTQNRKKTIKEFSRRIADKEIMLENQNIDSLKEDLLKVPGIGPWSAEYIALRACGDRDSFPATDLVLKRALKEYPDMDLEKLKPWRSYAAISLWRHSMKPLLASNSLLTKRKKIMTYVFKTMPSPVGVIKLIASDVGLAAILWEKEDPKRVRLTTPIENKTHPILLETEKQLTEYFTGKLKKFTLKLDFKGTEFQKKVWNALLTIPFGETRTYQQIAQQIGNPKAVRAVGAANGRNPIAIIAPCHRVIGANGTLTGFAGGLKAKECLLDIEHNQDFKRNNAG